uniref:Uncharacterized protein n=1 Tax=Caenorhabditis japonica TaxID=281687 RepID=A0A8R1I032_CAEJA
MSSVNKSVIARKTGRREVFCAIAALGLAIILWNWRDRISKFFGFFQWSPRSPNVSEREKNNAKESTKNSIEVQNAEINWMCCDERFDNRADFIEHRRLHIPTQHEEVVVTDDAPEDVVHHQLDLPIQIPPQAIVAVEDGGVNEDGEPTSQNIPAHFIQNPDGTVQVIIPEGIEIAGDVYLLFDDYENGKISSKVQLIPQHQLIQEDESGAGGSGHHLDGHHLIIQQEGEVMEIQEEEEVAEEDDQRYEEYHQMHMGNEWANMMLKNRQKIVNDFLEMMDFGEDDKRDSKNVSLDFF